MKRTLSAVGPSVTGEPGVEDDFMEGVIGLDSLTIAPAERFDVIIDFARYQVGTRATVRNRLGRDSTADVAGRTPSTCAPPNSPTCWSVSPTCPGRYVMHCHNLEHEDMAMMACFEVIPP